MTIFEILKEHQSLIEEISELEELTPELEKKYAEILQQGENKFRSFYLVYRNKAAQIPGIEAEIKRISAIKKRVETEMERIKKIMDVYMKLTKTDSIKDGIIDVIQAKKTTFVYDSFPKEFINKETIEKQDLAGFKKWAKENPDKAGKIGAKFIEGTEIRIK